MRQLEALLHGQGQLGPVGLHGVAGVHFCAAHRGFGVAQQFIDGGAVGRMQRQPHAGPQAEALALVPDADGDGLVHRLDQPIAQAHRGFFIDQAAEHDHEFIRPDPGDGVAGAHHLVDAAGGFEQHGITGSMTGDVVDLAETVQVEVQHGHAGVVALRNADLAGHPVAQQGQIGQTSEHIVQRLVQQLGLGLLELVHRFAQRRHVTGHADRAQAFAALKHRGLGDVHETALAVGLGDPALAACGLGLPLLAWGRDAMGQHSAPIGQQWQVFIASAQHLAFGQPQAPAEGRVAALIHALGILEKKRVGNGIEHRAQRAALALHPQQRHATTAQPLALPKDQAQPDAHAQQAERADHPVGAKHRLSHRKAVPHCDPIPSRAWRSTSCFSAWPDRVL